MNFNPSELGLVAAVAAVALILGAVLAWTQLRRGAQRAFAEGRAGREVEMAQLIAERDSANESQRRLQRECEAGVREIDIQRARILELVGERAKLVGRIDEMAQIRNELAESRAEGTRLIEARQRAEQRETELRTRLAEQHQAAIEKLTFLDRVREEFSDKFKALAGDLLEEKSKKFTEQNAVNLGTLLNPLREQLGDFRKTVTEVYDKESRERELLKHEIDALKQINQRIGEDALNLTRALKGESQTQGAWGEMVLERVLEASGLQKGREYDTQVVLKDEIGGRPRPDVIVHLPEGRDLIIDSKVSLTAYERYCSASDERERATHLAAHLTSLRNKIKELADKNYAELAGVNSLEFVLMFVPVEAAYIEAVHKDDGLHAFALERQVVMVTTSTLLATLRTVNNLWRFDDRNRNAQEIAERAGKLYDKFVGFVADLLEAKKRVDAAAKALDAASNKLDSGAGSLTRQVEMLKDLGAKTSKSLPQEMRERAEAAEPLWLVPAPKKGDPA